MDDLSLIKKYYGENMSHLCRELFPTILETNGLLFNIINSKFNPSKFLYEDIIEQNKISEFKNYIYSLIDKEKNNKKEEINKTPFELLDEAGYTLYECKSENDIQKFKKYYINNEELCTFRTNRLETCYVFFAVKKNVDEIKRENFKNPKRQDEYGTSVISIQFSRGNKNTLSIKNRYNHIVSNPDATFSNNLDNIISGLTESFKKYYGFNITNDDTTLFELENYVIADDDKYYKYNYEINNIYYCPDNTIIDGYHRILGKYRDNKERYIILDYFILDLKEKKLIKVDMWFSDAFYYSLGYIDRISTEKSNDKKIINIISNVNRYEEHNNHIKIVLDKYNRIIEYYNEKIELIGNYFLRYNLSLEKIEMPNVCEIGDSFLYSNENITEIKLSNIIHIGNNFLYHNKKLEQIILPNVRKINEKFLFNNIILNKIEMPNLLEVGYDFLHNNEILSSISLPKLEVAHSRFLVYNKIINEINLPNLKNAGINFMLHNEGLTHINFPKLEKIDNFFLYNNKKISKVVLPSVQIIGDGFLNFNTELLHIDLQNVKKIGRFFCYDNKKIRKIKLPNLEIVGDCFLASNKFISCISLPKVRIIGSCFFAKNDLILRSIDMPLVEAIEFDCLYTNNSISSLNMPNLRSIGRGFLYNNIILTEFNAPQLDTDCVEYDLQSKNMQELINKNIENNICKRLIKKTF